MKPVLQALVVADNVYQDRATGKFIIAGTFTGIFRLQEQVLQDEKDANQSDEGAAAEAEPVESSDKLTSIAETLPPNSAIGSPHAYICMTDFWGEDEFLLRYVELENYKIIFEGKIRVRCEDKLASLEFHVPLPRLPMKAGDFALELLHKDEPLGSWRISVRKVKR